MSHMTPEAAVEMRKDMEKPENQRRKYEKIFRRIGKFKKYTSDVCAVISNHTVKVAALRDKNDEVAKCLDDFTKIEEFSTTSKLSMAVVAELMATVGDHQDLAVQRVETLVLPNLTSYSRICDCVKADVWNAIQAIQREKRKRKCVNTLKRKADDSKSRSCLNDAKRELERASAETARFCELSDEQVLKFEHKRLIDLKESLGNFVKVQIATHAKSLELLSETYKQIQSIDDVCDLEILRNSLKIGKDDAFTSKKGKTSSSGLVVKQKKSQRSLGTGKSGKSSSSNLKESRSRVENESSSSAEEMSMSDDSSHSEVVRHLEKVLHSNSQDLKGRKQTKKRSKSEVQQSRSEASERHLKTGGNSRRRREEDQIGRPKSRENDSKFSDEEYPPVIQPKLLGKRPSAPIRALTVPTGGVTSHWKSSAEDLSSRREVLVFENRKKLTEKKSLLDTYYYSQSEDEKRYKPGSKGDASFRTPGASGGRRLQQPAPTLTSNRKQVTFTNPSGNGGKQLSSPKHYC